MAKKKNGIKINRKNEISKNVLRKYNAQKLKIFFFLAKLKSKTQKSGSGEGMKKQKAQNKV